MKALEYAVQLKYPKGAAIKDIIRSNSRLIGKRGGSHFKELSRDANVVGVWLIGDPPGIPTNKYWATFATIGMDTCTEATHNVCKQTLTLFNARPQRRGKGWGSCHRFVTRQWWLCPDERVTEHVSRQRAVPC